MPRMVARLRRWWNMPLKTWQTFVLVGSSILFWQLVKAVFPEQSKAFADTFLIPLLILAVILAAWGVYRGWQRHYAQPPRRP
jgi:hypothetical protein